MSTAKCPKCGNVIAHVQIEPLEIKRGPTAAYHGVGYGCPKCHTILSVGIDPVTVKMDILKQLLDDLRNPPTPAPVEH